MDGTWYGGVGNAGVKPTVMQENRENCLKFTFMDYAGNAYGKYMSRCRFLEFERPETKI